MRDGFNKEVCTCHECSCQSEQFENLIEFLSRFFILYKVKQLEEDLWEWYTVALGSEEMDAWDSFDRTRLALQYQMLKELMNVLHEFYKPGDVESMLAAMSKVA